MSRLDLIESWSSSSFAGIAQETTRSETALKAAIESAPSAPRSSREPEKPTIKAAIPMLLVSNVTTSAEFFRDTLGFTIEFLHGHPAFYGAVSRGRYPFRRAPVVRNYFRGRIASSSLDIAGRILSLCN